MQQKKVGWEVIFSELGFAKIIETMKVLINTIGKKIHTLVKKNTPCGHKIRQEHGLTRRPHFSLYYCVFFPTVMQILEGRLDS